MTRKSFRPAVLHYFEQNPDRNIYLNELARAIGASEEQAQGAMVNLRANMPEFPIRIIVRGNVWQYDSHAAAVLPARRAEPRMFEELATTKDGSILIQDQDGVIYRAIEM